VTHLIQGSSKGPAADFSADKPVGKWIMYTNAERKMINQQFCIQENCSSKMKGH
jgi:hypothetical protein